MHENGTSYDAHRAPPSRAALEARREDLLSKKAASEAMLRRFALEPSAFDEKVIVDFRRDCNEAVAELQEVQAALDALDVSEGLAEFHEDAGTERLMENEQAEDEGEDDEPDSGVLTFPSIAWRGPFALYREAMVKTTEASNVFHFASLWATVAVRLRRRVHFSYGMDLYPNVFLTIFGPTGDRKTTAARGALRLLGNAGVKILEGSGSGEGLADWLSTEPSMEPVSHFLFLEELSELLARGKWDGATLIPFVTRVFDCPNRYETNYRKNPIALVNPTLSMFACTTPEVFWQYVRELDVRSGFINRFFALTGTGKEPIALPSKPDAGKLAQVHESLRCLDTLSPQEARFTPEAVQLWEEFYRAWRKTKLDSLAMAATERIPAYILKLAMVYAALEGTLPAIHEEQLKAAIAVGHYATKCAVQLMGHHRQGSVQGRCEEAIRRALKETTRELSRRQLWQRVGGRFDSSTFARALDGLTSAGEVEAKDGARKAQTLYGLAGRNRQ